MKGILHFLEKMGKKKFSSRVEKILDFENAKVF